MTVRGLVEEASVPLDLGTIPQLLSGTPSAIAPRGLGSNPCEHPITPPPNLQPL